MHKKLSVLVSTFFLLTVSAIAHAATITLRTYAGEGNEPKFVATGHGTGGICIDIMRGIERIDPSLKFVGDQEWLPPKRIEDMAKEGQIDVMCGIFRNKEREAYLAYAATPLFPAQYLLAVRADDTVQINSWNDVKALGNEGVILSLQGYTGIYDKMQSIGGLIIDANSKGVQANLSKLVNHHGRFFIHRAPGFKREITNAKFKNKVKLLPTVMATENFLMAFNKSVPREVIEKCNKAIAKLVASGEIARSVEKWDTE